MKEGSDKSVKIYAKAMMFDHIQRYGSLSSDVGSVLHLLEKIMAENAVQEYDSEFFHYQAASLKRRADELCEQEEVEWLLLFECSDIMELHSKMLIEDEEYMMESIVNEENRVPCPEGYLNPKKAFSVLYQKFVEEKVDLYEAFEFLLQYKEIEVYLDFYGEADDCVSMDGITFTEVHAYRPHIVDLSNERYGTLRLNLERFMLEEYIFDNFLPDMISMILVDDNGIRCVLEISANKGLWMRSEECRLEQELFHGSQSQRKVMEENDMDEGDLPVNMLLDGCFMSPEEVDKMLENERG